MTPYCFEHVFRASSPDAIFAAFFDAAHVADQDRQCEIVEREIIELVDRGDELRRESRVVPRRQLPALFRSLVAGPLHYVETAVWRRPAGEMAIEVRPSVLPGRISIAGTYRLQTIDHGSVHRRYSGEVSVNIAVMSARVERAIIAEVARTLPIAATCTQTWLDRQFRSSLSARA